MEKPGGFSRGPAHRAEDMPNGTFEVPNMVVTLKGLGPEVSMVETTPAKGVEVPPAVHSRAFLILSMVLLCLLAGTWYVMRRVPGKAGVIQAKASAITTDSATITWTTEQPSTSQVEYGTTAAYGILSVFSSPLVTSHSVNLTGLSPATTYYYVVLSINSDGQVGKSPKFTFTTGGAATAGGVGGTPVISRVTASGITTNSATIAWYTDQPLTSQVAYGPTTAYGSLSAFISSLVTAHTVNLTALTPGTTYNYSALSTNSNGQVITSANFTFTTASVAGVPMIDNVKVGSITANSATISWTTDQPSTSQVEFGITPTYGSLSVFGSSAVTSHSITVNGLTPGTIYDAAALSVNSAGQVGTSADITFTTTPAPPAISRVTAHDLTATSATISWTTDQPSTSKIDYGTSTAYGSPSTANFTLATSHSVTLRGLKPGTTYNYSATSTNSAGMQNSSPNLTFVTPAR